MKKFLAILTLAIASFVASCSAVQPAVAATTDVYFSPNGGATAALVREVNAAKTDIHVMSYQMTSKPIAEALMAAKERGVAVNVIVDKSQSRSLSDGKYCCAYKLAHVVPTLMDSKHPIHHNKVIIIDKSVVITGSLNFSNAAEKANAENMLVIRDPVLAAKYLKTWDVHAAHSDKF